MKPSPTITVIRDPFSARTFATLALSGVDLNFMFDLVQQAHFCQLAPHAIAPVAGGWGRMGATRCELVLIDAATFASALKAAHARASAPLPKRPRSSKAATAATKPSAIEKAKAKKAGAKKAAR